MGEFISQGVNIFRLNLLMERLVPDTMTGPMNADYLGNLTEDVNYVTGKGAYAIITPHNYGRYYGNIINCTSDFEAFWKTVAGAFKDNELVMFDTNNEYYGMAGRLVADLNQAAINGIRAAGATSQYVNVEGNSYTGAWTWTTAEGTDGLTNAQTMGNLTDPEDKILYQVSSLASVNGDVVEVESEFALSLSLIRFYAQMHQYLDSDGSGTSSTCVNSTIGATRLMDATAWLKSNNKIAILGEYAGAVNSVCEEAVEGMLNYIDENSDVWTGQYPNIECLKLSTQLLTLIRLQEPSGGRQDRGGGIICSALNQTMGLRTAPTIPLSLNINKRGKEAKSCLYASYIRKFQLW